MIVNYIKIREGIFTKKYEFQNGFNLIYSKKNTCGKTTLMRMLMYGLGFAIPNTKGINFSKLNIELEITSEGKIYKLIRQDSMIVLTDDQNKRIFILPNDQYELHSIIFTINNILILKNILGVFYVDQEKGWTLLNRGISIGSNRFNIEEFIQGISNRDCNEEVVELKKIESKISKYKYMLNMASYQAEIENYEERKSDLIKYKDLVTEIETLKIERIPIKNELKRLEKIIKENSNFKEYVENMKLVVVKDGVEIPVNKDTIVGFNDNSDYLIEKQKIIACKLSQINRKIQIIKEKMEEKNLISDIKSLIEMFDYELSKLDINYKEVVNIIESLQKQKTKLKQVIKDKTRKNNEKVDKLHKIIYSYLMELGLDERYIKPNKDYIFTSDLKSLSGAVLHKIVFSFKVAYISMVKSEFGVVLPIILDSPSGHEVDKDNIQRMLDILARDYKEHQIIIASIFNYKLPRKKVIELKERVLEE